MQDTFFNYKGNEGFWWKMQLLIGEAVCVQGNSTKHYKSSENILNEFDWFNLFETNLTAYKRGRRTIGF